MPPARTKDRLLDAAGAVVQRDGAQALTLDAVAAEAEVSKGGLLYHFKSKRDLSRAMVERWLAEFQREIDAADPALRARLREGRRARGQRAGDARGADRRPRRCCVAVREQYGIWQDRVEREGRDPVDATVARLAADGLWLAELLGMGPPTGELREQVLQRLLDLAEPLD